MHRFDVERLLAEITGGVAVVRSLERGVRREDVLGVLRGQQGVSRVVKRRVLGRVGVQRRGCVPVENRHGLAAPVDALVHRPGDAVSRAKLSRLIPARSIGQVLAVVRGISGVDLLAVVGTARLGIAEPGRGRDGGRRGGRGAAQWVGQRLAQAVHRHDRRENRRREVQVGADRAPVLSPDRVLVELDRERMLDLRCGSAGRDVGVVRRCGADREARRAEPVPYRLDRGIGRSVLRAHLCWAQVVTVGAAGRVGHRRGDGLSPGLVTQLEVDAELDNAVGRGRRDLVGGRGPRRVRVRQRSRAGRAGRCGHGDAETDSDGGPA